MKDILNPENLAELKRVTRKAGAGGAWYTEVELAQHLERNASAFIAALTPDVALQLISTVQEQAQEIEALRAALTHAPQKHDAMPELPQGIINHPRLGPLFDRLQVHIYAFGYAEELRNEGGKPVPGETFSDQIARASKVASVLDRCSREH
ncbi:hypothetical protein D3C78_1415870 [compost metagenome]